MRHSLWTQLAPYRRRHPAVRWLEPGTWHLTLLFLGTVAAERVPELVELVDRVAATRQPSRLGIDGGGGHVHRSGGVGWLVVREGAAQVIASAGLLLAACPPDITVGAPPKRTPAAHLTVARDVDQATLEALTAQRYGPLMASWSVDGMALVRSHLGSGGARYETLHEATLYPREE